MLSETFVAHAGPAAAALAGAPDLESTLARLWGEAREAWPGVRLPPEAFVRRLGEAVAREPGADPLATLQALPLADLYLACGCAAGDPAALAAFDEHFLVPATRALAQARGAGDFGDEVRQTVRVRLLSAEPPRPPRIAGYLGRGPLLTWVRVAAARAVLNLRRGPAGREIPVEDPLEVHAAVAPDPELDYLRHRHAADFRAAFKAALEALPPTDGAILRLHYLDGLGTDQVAALYDLPRRTLQRRLLEIRRALLDDTRRALAARLGAPAAEVDSLMSLLDASPDTTFVRLLRER